MNSFGLAFVALVTSSCACCQDECEFASYLEERVQRCSTIARPVASSRLTTVVHLNLQLTSIHSIEEQSQIFQGMIWLEIMWMDSSMAWNYTEYDQVSDIIIPAKKIWMPDICFSNDATNSKCLVVKEEDRVMLGNNGMVYWWVSREVKTHCMIDINKYPFDAQNCSLKLGTWYSNDEKVKLQNVAKTISLDNYETNSEWDLIKTNVIQYKLNYNINFTEVHFQVIVRRRPAFYVCYIILPVLLLSILNILTFFLPLESGEKIGLSVAIFLSYAVFVSVISESLPKQSNQQFSLGNYMTIELVMSALTIAMEVSVLRIFHRPKSREIGWLLAFLLPKQCCQHYRLCQTGVTRDLSRQNSLHAVPGHERPLTDTGHPWKVIAERLDKLCCTTVTVVNALSLLVYVITVYDV